MTTFDRMKKVFDAVFEGEVNSSQITEQSNLKDDIGINSIGMLYMAMALEEEFGIKFVNSDFEGLQTVADVMNRIEEKL